MKAGNMETKPRVTPYALTGLETAKDKARTMEKELVTALSELEQAVEKWNKEVERWRQNPG